MTSTIQRPTRDGWYRVRNAALVGTVLAFISMIVFYFNTKIGLGSSRVWVEIGSIHVNRFWALVISAGVGVLSVILLIAIAGSTPFSRVMQRVRLQGIVRIYTVIILVSVLAGFLCFEAYWRFELHNRIYDMTTTANSLWIQTHTLTRSPVDDFFARKTEEHPQGLFKINTTFDIAVVHPSQGTLNLSVRSNNVGLLSDKDYQFTRDSRRPEYRIVVLGDSMTGPTTSTYQWVDTIEDLLNANQTLREQVGGKKFRVYNLGWVAAGFQTFWKAYEKSGRYFSPDMVLVNYIEIDFPRTDGAHLKSEDDMVAHAKLYLSKLYEANANVVVTLMPHISDMMPTFTEYKLTQRLNEAEPRAKVVIMRDHLPTHLGPEVIEQWFNSPHDSHYSDRGGEIYARALAGVITARLIGTKIDFRNAPSKYADQVLGPDKPKTRKIVTSLSPLADDSTKVAAIKTYIKEEMLRGKVYTWYPYSQNFLLGLGTDGIHIPYTQPLKGGFERVSYGSGSEDFVYLNVMCTSDPLSLRNPECYHHFHMYAK